MDNDKTKRIKVIAGGNDKNKHDKDDWLNASLSLLNRQYY
jgi:hypothetical protein